MTIHVSLQSREWSIQLVRRHKDGKVKQNHHAIHAKLKIGHVGVEQLVH